MPVAKRSRRTRPNLTKAAAADATASLADLERDGLAAPASRPAAPVSMLQGSFDDVIDAVVKGWVHDAADPTARLAVEVMVNGAPVLTVLADEMRADLLEMGVGDGRHAFTAKLPPEFIDGLAHTIRCVAAGREYAITGATDRFVLGGEDQVARLQGALDTTADGVATGWAWRPYSPADRVTLAVKVDGRFVVSTIANGLRMDLLDAGIGDGRYMFEAALPMYLLDGQVHHVEIADAVTGFTIPATTPLVRLSPPTAAYRPFDAHEMYSLFDSSYYQQHAGPNADPLRHYLDDGWKRGFNPHPLFDTEYYMARYGAAVVRDPLSHFFAVGRWANHHTHPLFDPVLQNRRRPDVRKAGIHPLFHYLSSGYKEMPVPSRFFDEAYYNHQYPGVREAGFIPLVHYLTFGWAEGRRPHPEFDPRLFARLADTPKGVDPYTHFVRGLLTQRSVAPSPASDTPRVSVMILNLSKSMLTLQCLHMLALHTDMSQVEVIIVDNGSPPDRFALLAEFAGNHRLVRLSSNRGFGEANNIGADEARGEFVAFLNNDAFVTPGWLDPLLETFAADPLVGAAGPKFIYPDGRLQEAGGMVAPCGTVLQRGKFMDGSFSLFDKAGPNPVDFCSAALLVMRTESFNRVLGYDLCWDPAYYEDVDLCLKLRLIGQHTMYVPSSVVVHIENGTSSDQSLDLRLHDIVGVNRLKFVSRWSRYLSGTSDGTDERRLVPSAVVRDRPGVRKRLALYSPYPMTPGGGERYLLSIAAALREDYDCTFYTPERYSRSRLATMARELELDVDHVRLSRLRDVGTDGPFDIFIAMGNEILPSVPGLGVLNLYLCQFPFPLEDSHFVLFWDNLATYQSFICYSEFADWHIAAAMSTFGIAPKTSHLLSPPVPQVAALAPVDKHAAPLIILNVGRFFPGGHCKRQDVMIEEFRKLLEITPRPIELHLAGSLGGDTQARTYLSSLQEAARGLPVFFHINIMSEQIHDLYRQATVYWHLTGINDDVIQNPERFEHFGITIGEAMSAGVIPVVLKFGGPPEIITNGWNGYLIGDQGELRQRTLDVISMDDEGMSALSTRARERAATFAPSVFSARLREIIGIEAAALPLARPGPLLDAAD